MSTVASICCESRKSARIPSISSSASLRSSSLMSFDVSGSSRGIALSSVVVDLRGEAVEVAALDAGRGDALGRRHEARVVRP
jgi:hypothetical protein